MNLTTTTTTNNNNNNEHASLSFQDCLIEWLRSRQYGGGGGGGGGGGDGGGGVGLGGVAMGGEVAAGGRGVGRASAVLQYQRCELCREKLVFRARYRADAPKLLAFSEVNDTTNLAITGACVGYRSCDSPTRYLRLLLLISNKSVHCMYCR